MAAGLLKSGVRSSPMRRHHQIGRTGPRRAISEVSARSTGVIELCPPQRGRIRSRRFASNALGKSYQRISESQVKTRPASNKLKVVGCALGGRVLIRSLQFLFGLMVELLVPSIRFCSLLPKFIGAAYNFNPGRPCHFSFLSLLPDGRAGGDLHDLYAFFGRWVTQL
jgi:hypothetical protein